MSHPRQTDERWPLLLADTPRISVDAIDDGTEYMVLFGDGGPIRQAAITRSTAPSWCIERRASTP